jgi:hypothetical protein
MGKIDVQEAWILIPPSDIAFDTRTITRKIRHSTRTPQPLTSGLDFEFGLQRNSIPWVFSTLKGGLSVHRFSESFRVY